MKFLTAFIPAFLTTAIPLGTIYVLITNALRADRKSVEEWLDNQRHHLSNPLPILEKSQPVMIGALYAIYGRSVPRRFLASFFIALMFTSMTFGIVYWHYRQIPPTVRLTKAQLERDVDPVLYKYVTDPELRPEYDKLGKTKVKAVQGAPGGPAAAVPVPAYTGGIYDELRDRVASFPTRLAERIRSAPARRELTFLLIIEGTYIDPHFRFSDFSGLFGFNVLLDFLSATIAIGALQLLGRKIVFGRAIITFGFVFFGNLTCAIIAFLSYRLFFGGNTEIFRATFLLLLCFLFPALLGILWRAALEKSNYWITGFLTFWGTAFLICAGLLWARLSSGLVNWHDMFSIPYVLAGTTLVPATVSTVAFALMLMAKLVAEPARVLPEAYMVFVTEQLGATQAAGIIIVLSAAIAAVVSH